MSTAATRPSSCSPRSSRRPRSRLLGDGVEIRHVDGTDRPALLAAVADADALLVRSRHPGRRRGARRVDPAKVVARAGVGLDNVDVPAATARGVMVVNAPTSNIVSAAEHAIALLLATARQIPAADASLRAGTVEAQHVHRRRDQRQDRRRRRPRQDRPAVRAAARRVRRPTSSPTTPTSRRPAPPSSASSCSTLDELLARADIISIHLPKTPETLGLIGKDQLALTKPGVHHRQRRPRRPGRRGRAGRRRAQRARRRRGHRRLRHRAHHRPARCSSCRRSWSPRTWAPPPPRRRTAPAPTSPARCCSRWPASSSPTR